MVDGGVMESRRHLNVRGKSATLPAITEKDWLDLKFGVEAGVDAFALSFVKVSARVLRASHGIGPAAYFRPSRTTTRAATCSFHKASIQVYMSCAGITLADIDAAAAAATVAVVVPAQDAEVIHQVKEWLSSQGSKIKVGQGATGLQRLRKLKHQRHV